MNIFVRICLGFLAAIFAVSFVHLHVLKKTGDWTYFKEIAPAVVAAPFVFFSASYYSEELFYLQLPSREGGASWGDVTDQEMEGLRGRSRLQGMICSSAIGAAFWLPVFLRWKRSPEKKSNPQFLMANLAGAREGRPDGVD